MNSLDTMRFFCGSSNHKLAQEIAAHLGIQEGLVELFKFSGGESYARIQESIRGFDCFVLQSIGHNPNDAYMELFILMDALKRASAKSVNLIVPHFAYGRQDKKSAPREPITSRLIADLLDAIGFDRLITMDLHSDQIQGFFSQPVDHLTALPIIADYINQKSLANLVVVAPDAGRVKFSKRLADRLHASLAMMYKTRPAQQVAKITNVIGEVKDKTILLVDDMIDTAGSVLSGIEALKAAGCGDVYLAATHPVFSGPAIERLSNAPLKEVIVTNTMDLGPDKHFDGLTVLSAAPLLAEAIRRNYQRRSISSLFN